MRTAALLILGMILEATPTFAATEAECPKNSNIACHVDAYTNPFCIDTKTKKVSFGSAELAKPKNFMADPEFEGSLPGTLVIQAADFSATNVPTYKITILQLADDAPYEASYTVQYPSTDEEKAVRLDCHPFPETSKN